MTVVYDHLFAYSARTSAGDTVRGTIRASTVQAAAQSIADMPLTDVRWTADANANAPSDATQTQRDDRSDPAATLRLLADQQPTFARRLAIRRMAASVSAGRPMIDAWQTERLAFPHTDRTLLDTAAANGRLSAALSVLAPFDAARRRYASLLRAAFLPPAGAWLIMSIVAFIWFSIAVGSFEKIFEDFNTELPAATLGMMNLGRWLQGALYPGQIVPGFLWTLAVPIAGAIFWAALLRSRPGAVDAVLYRFPHLGAALQTYHNITFGRAVALGMAAGLPRNRAVAEASSLIRSWRLHRDVRTLQTGGRPGGPAIFAAHYRVLTPDTVVALASTPGDPTAALARLAEIRIGQAQTRLMMVGPLAALALMAFMISAIAFGVLALFLPLVKIVEHLI